MDVATREAFTWRIYYHDDTFQDEFDEVRPDGHDFSGIEDLSQIKIVTLCDPDGMVCYQCDIPQGATPIFRRRHKIHLIGGPYTIHCIGWQNGDTGCYLFVFNNGTALLSSDFQAV